MQTDLRILFRSCSMAPSLDWYISTYRFFVRVFHNMIRYSSRLNHIFVPGVPASLSGMSMLIHSFSRFEHSSAFVRIPKYRFFWRDCGTLIFPYSCDQNAVLAAYVCQQAGFDCGQCLLKLISMPKDIQRLILAYCFE